MSDLSQVPLTTEAKEKIFQQHKDLGNLHFKAGQHKLALDTFKKALNITYDDK